VPTKLTVWIADKSPWVRQCSGRN